jgi:hypothetical protein
MDKKGKLGGWLVGLVQMLDIMVMVFGFGDAALGWRGNAGMQCVDATRTPDSLSTSFF